MTCYLFEVILMIIVIANIVNYNYHQIQNKNISLAKSSMDAWSKYREDFVKCYPIICNICMSLSITYHHYNNPVLCQYVPVL